ATAHSRISFRAHAEYNHATSTSRWRLQAAPSTRSRLLTELSPGQGAPARAAGACGCALTPSVCCQTLLGVYFCSLLVSSALGTVAVCVSANPLRRAPI